MKIVIKHLESIEGVEIFPIIALIIFFIFFTLVLIHTMKMDKKSLEEYSNIPLEDDKSTLSEL